MKNTKKLAELLQVTGSILKQSNLSNFENPENLASKEV